MNRLELQSLATERVLDAQALLDGARWSFAYDNAGYAVECALKAAFLARMPLTSWVFREKVRIEECRTHNFEKLIQLAELGPDLRTQIATSVSFDQNWAVVLGWQVDSRYSLTTTEQDAKRLFAAITDQPDGVLPWIEKFW